MLHPHEKTNPNIQPRENPYVPFASAEQMATRIVTDARASNHHRDMKVDSTFGSAPPDASALVDLGGRNAKVIKTSASPTAKTYRRQSVMPGIAIGAISARAIHEGGHVPSGALRRISGTSFSRSSADAKTNAAMMAVA
jgi:hypothetical protein